MGYEIGNPNVEQLIKTEEKKRNKSFMERSKSSRLGQSRGGDQIIPSLELDIEPIVIHSIEDFKNSTNFREYLFVISNRVEDFEQQKLEKRLERLHRYSIWKMNKWKCKEQRFGTPFFSIKNLILFSRSKIEQKQQEVTVVCKICASDQKIDVAKDHFSLCKNRAEINQQAKGFERKAGEIVLEAFLSSKSLQTQLQLDKKTYTKLKEKYMKFDYTPASAKPKSNFRKMSSETSQYSTCSLSGINSPNIPSKEKDEAPNTPMQNPKVFRTMKTSSFLADLKEGFFVIVFPTFLKCNISRPRN